MSVGKKEKIVNINTQIKKHALDVKLTGGDKFFVQWLWNADLPQLKGLPIGQGIWGQHLL